MQKSLYAIAGLGIAGCVTLTMMLGHVLEVREQTPRSMYETELETELGAALVEPAVVRELDYGGRTHLHAHLVVAHGTAKDVVAARAGARLWDASDRGGRGVVEVVLYVDDEQDDGARLVVQVPHKDGAAPPKPPR